MNFTREESNFYHSDFDLNQEPLDIPTVPHLERGIAGFVSKLYQCLQSDDSSPKYARWCRHDDKDMFVIDCIPEFTKVVLPRLFKHSKFPSFVRQLNIYGFQRDTDARKSKDTRNKDSCRWYHPYFRPNRRDLFHLIRRKSIRHPRKKSSPPVEEDPDTILTVSGDEGEVLETMPVVASDFLNEEPVQNNFIPDVTECYTPYHDFQLESLQLQIHELQVKYNKTEDALRKELQHAHMYIQQQQQHIQELEYALSISTPVKLETDGYMNGNYNMSFYHTNHSWIHSQQQQQQQQQTQQQQTEQQQRQQQQQTRHYQQQQYDDNHKSFF